MSGLDSFGRGSRIYEFILVALDYVTDCDALEWGHGKGAFVLTSGVVIAFSTKR